jgi:tRNA pseudouridine65 synthase
VSAPPPSSPSSPSSPVPSSPPPLTVLYRDDRLVAVDKPSGLLVHRGESRFRQDRIVAMTLLRDQIGARVFPVHRLDRGTSGVLLFALDPEAAAAVQASFAAGLAAKRYWALVRGIPPEEMVIDHPVPNDPGGPKVPAVTGIRRLATCERYALVEARPRTGRFHQIRRHLKHASHPILGDVEYGKGEHNRLCRERFGLWRLALHAAELALPHPEGGGALTLAAPLPADLAGPLAAMGLPAPGGAGV